MKDKIQAFYEKAEKYGGWQQVPAKRAYAIFEEVIEPHKIGFSAGKPGLLARPVDADITHVIKLRPLKGASFDICYGASLSYVPYPYVPKPKWHRTPKSANLDLLEEPQVNWGQSSDHHSEQDNPYLVHASLGEKCFREELSRAWDKSFNDATAWFNTTESLQGILQKCTLLLSRKHEGVRHLPGPRLLNAFTLAKLGRLDEAESELHKFFEEFEESAQARANLDAALRQISVTSN